MGAWGLGAQLRAEQQRQRSELLVQAIAARAAPGSEVATLAGTGPAAGATGFAAFTADGRGYVVVVGLPRAPAGQTYQAWYIVDGQAHSAGVVDVGEDGVALLSGLQPLAGTSLIAFTVEARGGVTQPTSDPILSGQLTA